MKKTLTQTAVLLTALNVLTISPAHATMSQEQMASELIGKTLNGKRGLMSVKITLAQNGQVAMNAALMKARGTWKFNGQQLCMNMTTGPRTGERCLTFTKTGANSYQASDGAKFTTN